MRKDSIKKLKPAPDRVKSSKDTSKFTSGNLLEFNEETRKLKPPRQLLGPLIHEEETTFIFADTNQGKTTLSLNIAEAIATGQALKTGEGIELENQTEAQKVAYFDFEQSRHQILDRTDHISLGAKKNIFLKQLKRSEQIEPDPEKAFTDIASEAKKEGAKVIFIDNMSSLSADLEEAKKAVPFMQSLQRLSRDEGFTVIIILHTPKLSANQIFTTNHISGSKKLSTFADAIIGISEQNNSTGGKYIKQIKSRSSDKIYGRGSVLCSKIEKVDGVLRHVLTHTDEEDNLLDPAGAEGAESKYQIERSAALAYIKAGSYRKAATDTEYSQAKIQRAVKNFRKRDPDEYHQLEIEAKEAIQATGADENQPF